MAVSNCIGVAKPSAVHDRRVLGTRRPREEVVLADIRKGKVVTNDAEQLEHADLGVAQAQVGEMAVLQLQEVADVVVACFLGHPVKP